MGLTEALHVALEAVEEEQVRSFVINNVQKRTTGHGHAMPLHAQWTASAAYRLS